MPNHQKQRIDRAKQLLGIVRKSRSTGGSLNVPGGSGSKHGAGWFSDAFSQIPGVGSYIKQGMDAVYNKVHPGENKLFGDDTKIGKIGRNVADAAVKAGLAHAGAGSFQIPLSRFPSYVSKHMPSKDESRYGPMAGGPSGVNPFRDLKDGGSLGVVGGKSKKPSAWNSHVSQFRSSHPHLSFKEALQQAKSSYHK